MSAARSASPPAARPVAIPKPSSCRKCKAPFASRNALFEHLRGACPGQQKAPAAVVATVPAPAVAVDDDFGCPTVPQPAGNLAPFFHGFSTQGLSVDDDFGNTSPPAELSTPLATALTPALAVIEAVCATILAAVVRRLTAAPAAASLSEAASPTADGASSKSSSQQQLLSAGNFSPQRHLQPAALPTAAVDAVGTTVPAAASPAINAGCKTVPAAAPPDKPSQQHLLPAGNLSPQRPNPAGKLSPLRLLLPAGNPSPQRYLQPAGKPPPQRCFQPTPLVVSYGITRRPHAPWRTDQRRLGRLQQDWRAASCCSAA
ncbi:hypothetical protein OCS_06258 [Ophiocordyceps sinensis CO18]|uniref:Uncharacterized protein n=1 Tax=Ophiocordyceps sinensis (strain Co18 / CGMCC 3.14243) TaxID=911162 RepID=T4ZY12_OPHSC|nr:hypothetical protein OCS_06258 [Ophiocordyceps sinensis CO18]